MTPKKHHETVKDIFACAVCWISADADHPDTPPAAWQAVLPLMRAAPELLEALEATHDALSEFLEDAGAIHDEEPRAAALRAIANSVAALQKARPQ